MCNQIYPANIATAVSPVTMRPDRGAKPKCGRQDGSAEDSVASVSADGAAMTGGTGSGWMELPAGGIVTAGEVEAVIGSFLVAVSVGAGGAITGVMGTIGSGCSEL